MRVAITFTLMAALAHWLLSPEGVEAVATLTLFLAILWRMKVIYGMRMKIFILVTAATIAKLMGKIFNGVIP